MTGSDRRRVPLRPAPMPYVRRFRSAVRFVWTGEAIGLAPCLDAAGGSAIEPCEEPGRDWRGLRWLAPGRSSMWRVALETGERVILKRESPTCWAGLVRRCRFAVVIRFLNPFAGCVNRILRFCMILAFELASSQGLASRAVCLKFAISGARMSAIFV